MGRFFLGKHLYNQIVLPLVVAALAVGVMATVVATYFLSDLTDRWVDQVAENASASVLTRVQDRVDAMHSVARLIADGQALVEATEAANVDDLELLLDRSRATHGYADIAVLDRGGRLVAGSGFFAREGGDAALAEDTWSEEALVRPVSLLTLVDGRPVLVALEPVATSSGHVLRVAHLIDDALLGELATGAGSAFVLYVVGEGRVALSVAEDPEDGSAHVALAGELDEDPATVADVVAAASASVERTGVGTLDVEGRRYTVRADALSLTDAEWARGEDLFLVSLLSQEASMDARAATMNLIGMWSFIAVLALVGLGGWVARRVSDPLVELTEGARKVADGDFSAKTVIKGDNEIAELATSFNQMTDSLKDRSESLTKKVLELATLYEMSRSLGSTLDMDELLDSVLDSALRIFSADLGYVTMRDPETGELAIRAHRGVSETRIDDAAVRSSMSEWVIRESRPLVFNPAEVSSHGQVEVVTGALAALCVPLVSGEGTVGAITVGSQDPDHRFDSEDVRLLSTIANHVTIAIGNIDLFSSLQEAYLTTVRSLAAAVDAKDPYTRGHSDGVAVYAALIAEEMGLSHDQKVALEMAAYLHDIGKIGVKEEILLKPGTLTDAEMGQMRHHPLIGASILKPVAFPWPITPVVRHHHEFWDGNGYPAGLKGEEVPLLGRILAVADAYEAMISDRPYRKGRTMIEGVAELRRCAGTQFDPQVVEVFIEALERRERLGCEDADDVVEKVGLAEARAIFVALSEGMLSSFRRLGGPRLAGNVECELNVRFAEERLPIVVEGGRVVVTADESTAHAVEIDGLTSALRMIDTTMGRMSGNTLVDHFYSDAMEALPERMRCLATRLGFYVA